MIIIYNCYGGSHSSVTSAAIHLGLLPETRLASNEELLSIPYYDAQIGLDHGRIRFMGTDKSGNDLYIASKRNLKKYPCIMQQILDVLQVTERKVMIIDTMPYVNLYMMIGGFLSRRWGFNRIGRAIVLYGTRLSYYRFANLVQIVKQKI